MGGVAAEIQDSTNIAIGSSVLVDPFTSGEPIWFTQGSSSLTLTNDIAVGGAKGFLLDPPSAGPSVSINGLSFVALTPGATAINFSGGQFVSTFDAVAFDGSVGANVNAALMSVGSLIHMVNSTGVRTGPTFDDDPFGYVIWSTAPTSPPPPPPPVTQIGITNVSAYPNPVDVRNGPATIAFTLLEASDVRIRIMTMFGAKIRELHSTGGAGPNSVAWDGADDSGRKVSMGVYLAVINAAGTQAVEKIAVLR